MNAYVKKSPTNIEKVKIFQDKKLKEKTYFQKCNTRVGSSEKVDGILRLILTRSQKRENEKKTNL